MRCVTGSFVCTILLVGVASCGSESSGPQSTPAAVTLSPTPTAATSPGATTTETTTVDPSSVSETPTAVLLDECLRSLPFSPTYLPEGFDGQLRPGDGGEVGVGPDGTIQWIDPPSPHFVNYSAHAFRLGTFINITTSEAETPASYEPITVLGRPAQFGHIEDGYAVVFHTGDSQCDEYTIMTYGVSSEDTRRVAEGLAPTNSASQGLPTADLVLRSDSATLASRLVEGGVFDGKSAAVAPDGLIVVSKTIDGRIELYSFTEGKAPVDTGVGLLAGTSLEFGPGGDLFAVEYAVEGETVVSQFGRADGGQLVLRNSVSGPITGECAIAVTPAYVGCPINGGPQITFDPPVPFDQVVGDSHLAGTSGTGVVERTGTTRARWWVTLDSAVPVGCDDDICVSEWLPGPSGSAIYAPYLETPAGGNHLAVFVVDDRAIATGALIDPAELVLGLVRTDLICVQQVEEGQQLIAIDVTTLLN